MKEIKSESGWYCIKKCTTCDHELTDKEVYYNGGMCPNCAKIAEGSICDYKKEAVKKIVFYKYSFLCFHFGEVETILKHKDVIN